MHHPHDESDFDETVVLEDRKKRKEEEADPDATAVLDDEYRREIEPGQG